MRFCVLMLAAAAALPAQESSRTTYNFDAEGRRYAVADRSERKSTDGSARSESVQTLNGRQVPLETSEDRVISDGPDGRVVERIVKKFDATGRPTGSEKVRIEESKAADGSISSRVTTYDADLNGRYMVRDRVTTTTSKADSQTRAETLVERPTVSGTFEMNERKVAVTTGDENRSQKDVVVYRRDAQGRFVEAVREITETQKLGNETTSNVTEYNTAATGRMELSGQKVSQRVRNADGSESEVVDVYGVNNPGQVTFGSTSAKPVLRERQLIERTGAPGKGTVETFSVQRVELDSSNRLGRPQKISETVCTGECKN